MNKKVLHTLEFDKILAMLAEKADSEPARKLCAALVPDTDIQAVRIAQIETADALSRLIARSGISFGSNKDLGYCIQSLKAGAALSIPELLAIAGFLENVSRVKHYGQSDRDDEPKDSLQSYFDSLTPMSHIAEEIRRCLPSEEEVADDASAGLKQIRRGIRQTGEKIHSQLNSMINGSARV